VRDRIDGEALQRHLTWFSQVKRDTGGSGEEAAAAYIASQLEAHGIPVTMHQFDAYLSYPRTAKLEVLSPEPHTLTCVTHSFAASTPEHGLTLNLVPGAHVDMSGVAGEAVLIEGLCEPGPVYHHSQAGSGALIFANRDSMIHNMIATTIWGTPTPDQLHRLPALPVVSINRTAGDLLQSLLAKGPVTVRITTEVETGWFRSTLPEVRIPGVEDPEQFALVGAHYCAWDVGVTDNATGDALLLEMARLLWAERGTLRRSVRICWWPGHSHGRYSGSTWYADTFFEEISRGCIVYHNIDSPGTRGATEYVCRHTTAEMERFGQGMVAAITGQEGAAIHRPGRAADQSFLASGIPAFSCYPFLPEGHPDRRPWTGGSAGAWWWHTPSDDTLEKASIEVLSLDTLLSTSLVRELCSQPVLPLDHRATAAQILSYLSDLEAEVGGQLDLSNVLRKARAFVAAAEALQQAATAEQGDLAALNRALLRISRATIPVLYSKGGRFTHDPAELVPPQANRPRSVFPGLVQAFDLPLQAGRPEAGFLRTQIVREVNRVCAALDEATEIASAATGG
jgi:N-acetylated-alpha-linked acidic dipeptidase